MTIELFRNDSYLKSCNSKIIKIDDDGISAIDQIDIKNVVKDSFEKVKTSIFDNDEITFYKVI